MNRRKGGSPIRDKRGRWKPGVSGSITGKPKTLKDTSLDVEVLAVTNIARIAKTLAQRAHQGDGNALQEVLRIIQRNQPTSAADDLKLLSEQELLVMHDLLTKARGESAPQMLSHIKALLAMSEPEAIEPPPPEPLSEIELDDLSQQLLPETELEAATPRPAPIPVKPPPPPKKADLASGLLNRKASWLRDDNSEDVWADELPN